MSGDEKILRFYRTLRATVGFGEVWMRLDDDGSVLIEWYPRGQKHRDGSPYYAQRIQGHSIALNQFAGEDVAQVLREQYRRDIVPMRKNA